MKPVIRRYLSPTQLAKVKCELGFLIERVQQSQGEMALLLRDGYFNIYHRGNSLAKVIVHDTKSGYRLIINNKFVPGTLCRGSRFAGRLKQSGKGYMELAFTSNDAKAVFQTAHLNKWCRNVARVNYRQELTFEQMLITDNPPSERFMIVDRQVGDTAFERKKMDLLALRRSDDGSYTFEVIEIKMGNNPELQDGSVESQVKGYVENIAKHIGDYQDCYKKNVSQQRFLGLLPGDPNTDITIGSEVNGLVVVGGYSGMAEGPVQSLLDRFSASAVLKVKQCKNTL